MVDAVLLVLREVLEAALIICLLLSLSQKLVFKRAWVLIALACGFLGSWILAQYAYSITESWDGMGQELLNSILYAITITGTVCLGLLVLPLLFVKPVAAPSLLARYHFLVYCLCIVIVSFSIAREGSEIWIYLSSFTYQPNSFYAALVGGVIGVGIGVSLGAITYYALIFMPGIYFLPTFLAAITLLIGGLSMQIAEQLMQIGLLESTAPMWDTSFIVSEQSWLGELLYALLGYDAKPTLTQGIFYLIAVAPILAGLGWHLYRSGGNHA